MVAPAHLATSRRRGHSWDLRPCGRSPSVVPHPRAPRSKRASARRLDQPATPPEVPLTDVQASTDRFASSVTLAPHEAEEVDARAAIVTATADRTDRLEHDQPLDDGLPPVPRSVPFAPGISAVSAQTSTGSTNGTTCSFAVSEVNAVATGLPSRAGIVAPQPR